MKRGYLGEFEELVMLTCAFLKEEAYGINIVEEIKTKMDRTVTLGAVHVTLYRLEDKGLLTSHLGGATTDRGGRRKRIYQLSTTGLSALRNLQRKRHDFIQLIPELKLV